MWSYYTRRLDSEGTPDRAAALHRFGGAITFSVTRVRSFANAGSHRGGLAASDVPVGPS